MPLSESLAVVCSALFRCFGLLLIATAVASLPAVADDRAAPAGNGMTEQASKAAIEFVNRYCIDCHQTDAAEGDRSFSELQLPLTSASDLIAADEIVDQLTLRQMPPEDADQPSDAERLEAIQHLRTAIQEGRRVLTLTGRQTVIRRLSNREYENTIAALFDRRVDTLGLTADFPKDTTSHHLDNIGQSLVMSGFLLEQYFQAADRLVETRLGKPDVEFREWHFTDHFVQYEELQGSHKRVFNFEYLCLYEQPNTDTRQGGYGHIEDFLDGVPVSGLYDIDVHAQAMHRDTHYDPKIFRIDFSEPFQLAVVPGDIRKGHIHYPQAIEPILGQATVPDEQPEWLTFRVWLEAGQTPRFIFPNGPYESRASVLAVNKRYKDEFDPEKFRDGVSRAHILEEGALPHIRIGEVKIRGPIEEPEGSREERAVFGPKGFQPNDAAMQLQRFARKAWRRPLNDDDRKRLGDLYQKRLAEGVDPRRAALDTVKLILCSPSFLYFSEIAESEGPNARLKPHDLATRLSYALWAAPPDRQLTRLADSRKLLKDDVLKSQIQRLLADERSSEFVNGFLDGWLNLRDLGSQPPPRTAAWQYYSKNLPASMKQEARLFFRHVLDEDLPPSEFMNADYTFVDKNLAEHYGLPEKDSLTLQDGFRRVSLNEKSGRGGVLGMAGVLTVSANGVETSPVTRGVWVSENLLGITPPPPPDEVPEIDANVSGAKTIREKLALHSADQTCSVCHRKIDPYGFTLESFDPIGRYRSRYPKAKGRNEGLPIDTTGKLPSGETFENFEQFRRVLTDTRQQLFLEHLTRQLLAYSTGRHMELADDEEIEQILERARQKDLGLRGLFMDVLTSQIFRSP